MGILDALGRAQNNWVIRDKDDYSSLRQFLNTITTRGVQLQSNFEVIFPEQEDLKFLCQDISIPGLKTHNAEIYYKCKRIQVPIVPDQDREIQMTVINDAGGLIYTRLRKLCTEQYIIEDNRKLKNGVRVRVKAIGDLKSQLGGTIILDNFRINQISGVQFGHTNNSIQTFTIDCFAQRVEFENKIH